MSSLLLSPCAYLGVSALRSGFQKTAAISALHKVARVDLSKRLSSIERLINEKGVETGTGHKRILIPKNKLTEQDLGTLGFVPVTVAIPESGQDRFKSFRHPDNTMHFHSHPEGWLAHIDRHPSSTMLAMKASKRLDKGKALLSGAPHILTEGLPGLAMYLKGRITGAAPLAKRVASELPKEVGRTIGRWADSPSLSREKAAAANPFKGGPGVFQSFGRDLMAGGKMLASPKLVAPGQFAQAGLGSRVGGEVAQSVGHHYAHKGTLGNLVNPLGGAFGGVAEGLTRAAGKEVSSAGASLPGAAGRAVGALGGGLQRVAKPAGMVGEVAGLAGLGTAVHAPLSVAGAVGGKMLGAVSHAAPVVGEALHSVGDVLAHGAHDVAGTTAQTAARRLGKVTGVLAPSIMPPPMGH